MKTKISVSSNPDLGKAVAEVVRDIADKDARLIVYFASTAYPPTLLAPAMAAAFPGVLTVGCTTAGEIVSGRMLQGSLVAMALGSDLIVRAEARLLSRVAEDARAGVAAAFSELSRSFGYDVGKMDPERHVGLILADGLSGAEERLMDAIGDGTNVSFVGGSAGDDLKFQQTRVFLGGSAVSDAAIVVIIEAAVPFQILKTQSFRVLPTRLVATKVNEPMRRVIEFNGEPAALAYAKATGVRPEQANARFMTNPLGLLAGDEIFVRSPQRIEGGSVGFQIGGSETDLIMLVMNQRGADKLLSSKFTLGAEGSVAAGPVGRTATAQTDAQMHAEILSWSRSQGLFAGLALEGATLRQDLDDNAELYGRRLENRQIVTTPVRTPRVAARLIALLNRYSARERTNTSTGSSR